MNYKNGKVFTSKFVGTGPLSYEKRIYRAAVSQRLRNTDLEDLEDLEDFWDVQSCLVDQRISCLYEIWGLISQKQYSDPVQIVASYLFNTGFNL